MLIAGALMVNLRAGKKMATRDWTAARKREHASLIRPWREIRRWHQTRDWQ